MHVIDRRRARPWVALLAALKLGLHALALTPYGWLWGFGGREPRAMILLGGTEEELAPELESLTRVTTVECGLCMPYENHKPVWVGRGLRRPLATLWPRLKHYE